VTPWTWDARPSAPSSRQRRVERKNISRAMVWFGLVWFGLVWFGLVGQAGKLLVI